MEHERLKDLVMRPATSPHRALAQKYLKDQLEKNHLHQGLHYSGTNLIFENLTIQDLMGLRRGPFTRSPFQTFRVDVRTIRHLDIAVVPFWKAEVSRLPARDAEGSGKDTSTQSQNPHHPDELKSGLKILHDWLSTFPPTNIKSFRFEWIDTINGINPLLLDQLANAWFSAPTLAWRGLEVLRLKGVDVSAEDVRVLGERNKSLESFIVETYWTDAQRGAGWVSVDPVEREIDVLQWEM